MMTDRLALIAGAKADCCVAATSDQSLLKDASQEAYDSSTFDSHAKHSASLLALCFAVGGVLCWTPGLLGPRFGVAVDAEDQLYTDRCVATS